MHRIWDERQTRRLDNEPERMSCLFILSPRQLFSGGGRHAEMKTGERSTGSDLCHHSAKLPYRSAFVEGDQKKGDSDGIGGLIKTH